MNEDLSHLEKEVAVLSSQLSSLIKISDEVRTDVRDIKSTQDNRIQQLEKEIILLKDQYSRLDWMYKLVLGLAVSGLIGAVLNLVINK